MDVTVNVDRETEVDETVSADEEFELGTAEDPLVAEEDVEIVVDGYDRMGQNISVTDIYGTEHISLSTSVA